MLSLFRTLSLRYLWRHQLRAALVVMSIALGVAAWVATRALYGTVTHALHQVATPLRGDADLYVTNNAARSADASLHNHSMRDVPGTERVDRLILDNVSARLLPAPKGFGNEPDRSVAILIGLPTYGEEEENARFANRDIEIIERLDNRIITALFGLS